MLFRCHHQPRNPPPVRVQSSVSVVEATDSPTSGLPFTSVPHMNKFSSHLHTDRNVAVATEYDAEQILTKPTTRPAACLLFRHIQRYKRVLCPLVYIFHNSKRDCCQEE